MNTLEYNLARFCSPALVGIKTSNLFCCINSQYKNLSEELKILKEELNFLNLEFFIISQNAERTMILVFQKDKMQEQLKKCEVKDFLKEYGYDVNSNYINLLNKLKNRINFDLDFPHEIGVFLGYPLDDTIDFIENKKKCKLIGTWKVYNNVDNAKKLFKQYKDISTSICEKIKRDESLKNILKEYVKNKC